MRGPPPDFLWFSWRPPPDPPEGLGRPSGGFPWFPQGVARGFPRPLGAPGEASPRLPGRPGEVSGRLPLVHLEASDESSRRGEVSCGRLSGGPGEASRRPHLVLHQVSPQRPGRTRGGFQGASPGLPGSFPLEGALPDFEVRGRLPDPGPRGGFPAGLQGPEKTFGGPPSPLLEVCGRPPRGPGEVPRRSPPIFQEVARTPLRGLLFGALRPVDHRMQCSYGGDGSRVAFSLGETFAPRFQAGWLVGGLRRPRRDV